MLNNLLTKEQGKDFNEYGYVVVKGFYDRKLEIEPTQYGIGQILKILFEKYHIEVESRSFSPDTFDLGYQKLIAANRKYGGEVYDAIKQIPAFMRLLSLKKNANELPTEVKVIYVGLNPKIARIIIGNIDAWHHQNYRYLFL
ncbi:hypothetical protein NG791_14550 [Laspinema sp. D1]|uniref:hypothetical protein n=1 Tax=Laspinema palackyanum TaxID=3231601 RepID=UPI0034937B48|nr:hypothetical protein [Laspinema sp. D2b]